MKTTEEVSKVIRNIEAGVQPACESEVAIAENLVGTRWLIRDNQKRYTVTPKAIKALRRSLH